MMRFKSALVAVTFFLLFPLALSAEVKVEGVLKAVNTKERTVTVERKTAKGGKGSRLGSGE
jgi:hypothetical protein